MTTIKSGVGLGVLIWRARTELHMPQKECAAALNLSPQYLHDIEAGTRNPTSDAFIETVHATLGISQDLLYFAAGKFPPNLREVRASEENIVSAFAAMRAALFA